MAGPRGPQEVGKLQSLEVENFKSYRGLHTIGPFVNFTAVIGPNGSGKSNLMDAISFVCGVKTTQLRGNLEAAGPSSARHAGATASVMQELLFCNTQSELPEDHPTEGRVTLVFENADGSILRFTRAIVPARAAAGNTTYSCKYRVDNKNVTLDEFTKRLLDLGVNTKARNFLVFQGDIEKTAHKGPSELRSFFETISGSSDLKEEYERREGDAANAEAAVSRLYQKKKQMQQRKKTMKAAKDEADKYNKERAELDAKKREHYLWQLYHVKTDVLECDSVKASHEERLAALHARRTAETQKLGSSDQELARLRKQRASLTRELEKLQAEAATKRPSILKIREFLNRENKKRQHAELSIKDKSRKKDECVKSLKELRDDLSKTQQALKRAETDLAASSSGDEIKLTPKMREQYQVLKLKAAQQCVDSTRKLRMEEAILKDEEAKLATEVSTLEQMQAQQERLTNDIEQATAAIAEAESRTAELRKRQAEVDAAVKDIQAKNRRASTDRVHLKQQLGDTDAKIQDARAEYAGHTKDRKVAEKVAEMIELYPSTVLGRLSDLCKISNRKHNVAVSVLMGRNMDSVVVTTQAQATICVQFLRDTRFQPMEFIPLDTIRVTPINGRMRSLGGTAKLAIDLVEYDASIENALLSVFGNAIMCDTLEEAKRLGHGPDNLKVVTLDGTLIARDGKMSGGYSKSMGQRATRWDAQASERLKNERAALQAKLDALPDEREAAKEETRLKESSNSIRMDSNAASVDADAARHRLQQKQRELSVVADGIAAKEPVVAALQATVDAKRGEPVLAALQAAVASKRAEVDELVGEINRVKDATFKDFSKKVGVQNVREYEERIEKQLQQREERLSKLNRHISTLETKIEMQQRRADELDVAIHAETEDLEIIDKTRTDLEAQKTKQAASAEAVDAKIEEKKEALAQAKGELDQVAAQTKGVKATEAAFDKEEVAIKRDIHKNTMAVTSLKDKAAGILQSAMLDGVDLGGAPAAAEADDDDDADEAAVPPELLLDYSSLSKPLRRTLDPDARARTDKQFAAAIEQLSSELQAAAPNLKAPEEYASILTEEQALQKEVDAAKAAAAQASGDFNQVRENRAELFNVAFAHVSESIDGIYKALTRSSVNTLGGTAYMSKEDEDEPYKGGITYCAIPPNKRYREMEQLSGGEKTLAALALLLAVHSFRPSPFFVLDEVDAALDASNLSRVANYIRQRTRSTCENPFQGIIISLKDVFYEKADALIGVSRNWRCNASVIYTWDLEQFGEPQA